MQTFLAQITYVDLEGLFKIEGGKMKRNVKKSFKIKKKMKIMK